MDTTNYLSIGMFSVSAIFLILTIIFSIFLTKIILLFPIQINRLNDGGTVEYRTLLYSITKYHRLDENIDDGYIDGIEIKVFGKKIYSNVEETPRDNEERIKLKDLKITTKDIDATKLVEFGNVLYGKSNLLIDYAGDLNKSIGKINMFIGEEYLPQLDGETNCKEFLNCNILEANDKTMVLNIDNVAVLFGAINKENIIQANGESLENIATPQYSSFVGTILEETTTYMIVEPNEDEIERKSADKIKINYGTDHIDYLYGIGRKVVIYYTGYIMESYPAQINTDKISTEGYEDFTITVKKSNDITKKKILNNKNLSSDKQDYNLYFYGLDEVNVTLNNKTMSLEDSLKSGKMTIDGIIQKANKDEKDGKVIKAEIYKDGGSTEYHYENYSIIKVHKLDGNRDVYIGIPNMKLDDLKL